jgi:hypothetical protein
VAVSVIHKHRVHQLVLDPVHVASNRVRDRSEVFTLLKCSVRERAGCTMIRYGCAAETVEVERETMENYRPWETTISRAKQRKIPANRWKTCHDSMHQECKKITAPPTSHSWQKSKII